MVLRTPKTATLRDEQKALTRQRILRAARGCFLSEGVAATSFDAIAHRAEVSRATVYLHFARKEALLLGMLEDDWAAQQALFSLLPREADRAALALWLGRMVRAYQRRRDSLGLYALALGQDPAVAVALETQRATLLGLLAERFAAFAVHKPGTSSRQRAAALLMLIQIEQFCLLAARGDRADIIEAGIELLAERMADFIVTGG